MPKNVAFADADADAFPIFGKLHPGGAVAGDGRSSLFIEKFEEMRAVAGFGGISILLDFRVEGLPVVVPLGRRADDLGSRVLERDILEVRKGCEIFRREIGGRVLLELFLRVEAAGNYVRSGNDGQRLVSKGGHGNEEFLGTEELLSTFADFTAALDGAGNLRKMHDAKIELGMALRVMGEGVGHGLGTGHAEIVEDVAAGGVGKIGVDDAPGEVGAVVGGAVEMVFVGGVVELVDQGAVLFDGGIYHEYVHAADESGGDHFAPFGFTAGLACGRVA